MNPEHKARNSPQASLSMLLGSASAGPSEQRLCLPLLPSHQAGFDGGRDLPSQHSATVAGAIVDKQELVALVTGCQRVQEELCVRECAGDLGVTSGLQWSFLPAKPHVHFPPASVSLDMVLRSTLS